MLPHCDLPARKPITKEMSDLKNKSKNEHPFQLLPSTVPCIRIRVKQAGARRLALVVSK